MKLMVDSFWRALAYCLHWRVILLSLLPLLLVGGASFGLGWFFWEDALDAVAERISDWTLMGALTKWLNALGAVGYRAVFQQIIVVGLSVPFVVVASVLAVGLCMTPSMVKLVVARRFPQLERRHRESAWRAAGWVLAATAVALVALLVTMPLWLIPPLALLLPPLVWGWLAYRVMIHDALADHATPQERRRLRREHRGPLLAIATAAGYAGGAPALLFAVSPQALIIAPILVVAVVWLHVLLFAFFSLWFAHYGLSALHRQRQAAHGPLAEVPGASGPSTLPSPTS